MKRHEGATHKNTDNNKNRHDDTKEQQVQATVGNSWEISLKK